MSPYAWCNKCHKVLAYSNPEETPSCLICECKDIIYNIPIKHINDLTEEDGIETPNITKEGAIDIIRQLIKDNLHRTPEQGYIYGFNECQYITKQLVSILKITEE